MIDMEGMAPSEFSDCSDKSKLYAEHLNKSYPKSLDVDDMKISSQSDFLKNLKLWGFKTNPFNKVMKGVKNLILNHKNLEEKRK